jgi:peptidoglycan L-alanyl-D-glutamate endopeptidase CwlK
MKSKQILLTSCLVLLSLIGIQAHADRDLMRLKKAYPSQIQKITKQELIWADGSRMPLRDGNDHKSTQEKLDNPALIDQMKDVVYTPGIPRDIYVYEPDGDPGRIRYEPFFRKMYGDSEAEVRKHLTVIYWMPKFFGSQYPLEVTTVNGVDKKLSQISQELEALVATRPDYLIFLENPGGTFKWRYIANTKRLSNHSFGMTIDINAQVSTYWQWDLKNIGQPISEDAPLTYRNTIPWEIIPIFEKYGFIWGGKWHHYDTMHFEYRPELLS